MRIPIVNTILQKNGKILMLKRNYYPENKLDLLGGFVDKNETIQEAAVREVKEESGLDVEIIQKMGAYDYIDRGDKTMHVYIGKINSGTIHSSKEGEPVWVKPEEVTANDLAFPQVHVDILKDYVKLFT